MNVVRPQRLRARQLASWAVSWLEQESARIAARFEDDVTRLVAVSSPSGDVAGAEAAYAVVEDLAPAAAMAERLPCSSPGHAPDLLLRVRGTGRRRVLLVGHVDTVVAHADHRPAERDGDRLVGSGTVDMKGGDVLALGVLDALSRRPQDLAEAAVLLVCDEEWRLGAFSHSAAFAGWDACLTFEGGERTEAGEEAVVVRRKAAGTLQVTAHGVSAHSGSKPHEGRNALLALAAAAQAVARHHDPQGPDHLTAVPTVLHCGDAFNVVPARGTLTCDLRADAIAAFDRVLADVPAEVGGARLEARQLREWPGMDQEGATQQLLARAGEVLGRPVRPVRRGGASDAAHFAAAIPCTVDGLGPLGAAAHNPGEWIDLSTIRPRAQLALAVADAALSA